MFRLHFWADSSFQRIDKVPNKPSAPVKIRMVPVIMQRMTPTRYSTGNEIINAPRNRHKRANIRNKEMR